MGKILISVFTSFPPIPFISMPYFRRIEMDTFVWITNDGDADDTSASDYNTL